MTIFGTRVLALTAWILAAGLSAGELENFETNVDFLKDEYKNVKSLERDSNIIIEYTRRATEAMTSSYRMQRALDKLGVKKTTLDTTLRKMIRSMGIAKVGLLQTNDSPTDFRRAYNDLHNQIAYLKEINYSFESNTFEPPSPEMKTYDAVSRFKALVTRAYRLSLVKTTNGVSESQKKEYLNLFSDMTKLAREIGRKLFIDKVRLPSGFDIGQHSLVFQKACENLVEIRSGKDYDKKARKKLENSKVVKEARTIVDFSARQLKNDIETLENINFRLRVDKVTLSATFVGPSANFNGPDKTENKKKIFFKTQEERRNFYQKKLHDAYTAEDKLRGVSEKFYSNYRKLLPFSRQKELDDALKRQIKNGIPLEYARAAAVRNLHTKNQITPCTDGEIKAVLEE